MRYFIQIFSKSFSIILAVLLPVSAASATPIKVGPGGENNDAVSIAKIYYAGPVTPENISELIQTVDDANIKYKSLKRIYIYINSFGGDMDSGYAGYWAIKSSRTPVTTVNIGNVMSSATMLFCGADDRQSLKGGRFLLHPASVNGGNAEYQPDQLERQARNLENYINMFRNVYKECTKLSDQEISSLLSSENQRREMQPDEAQKYGMITKIADKIVDGSVSYFVPSSAPSGDE